MNRSTEIRTKIQEISNLAEQGLDGLIICRYQELQRSGVPKPFLRQKIVIALLNSALALRESGSVKQARVKERVASRLDLNDEEADKKSLSRQLRGFFPDVFRTR